MNSLCHQGFRDYSGSPNSPLNVKKMIDDGKKVVNSIVGKGVFPPKYAFTLLIPFRNIFLSPKKLIRRLNLKEDYQVLEIGPGPGYFSTYIAKILKQGRLVLLDIQQEMLDMAKKRLAKKRIKNVEYKLTNGLVFDLESNIFDTIFMIAVMGEVENKEIYLKEIHRTLREGGTFSISELGGDPDKISIEEIQSLVCRYGFAVSHVYGNRRNYTINFRKTISP
jgi:ubiquinone/menaquinone biosynthesis C-methylase UbiE